MRPTGNSISANAKRQPSDIEMDHFDRLGPLTRKVLREAALELSAYWFIVGARERGITDDDLLDRDGWLADTLRDQTARLLRLTHDKFYPERMFTSDLGFQNALESIDIPPDRAHDEKLNAVARGRAVADIIAARRGPWRR